MSSSGAGEEEYFSWQKIEKYKEKSFEDLKGLAKKIHDEEDHENFIENIDERADHVFAMMKRASEVLPEYLEGLKTDFHDEVGKPEGLEKVLGDFGSVKYIKGKKRIRQSDMRTYAAKFSRELLGSLSKSEKFKNKFIPNIDGFEDDYLLDLLDNYLSKASGIVIDPGQGREAKKLMKGDEIKEHFYGLLYKRKGKEAWKFLKDAFAQYSANMEQSGFSRDLVPADYRTLREKVLKHSARDVKHVRGEDRENDYVALGGDDPQVANQIINYVVAGAYDELKGIERTPDATYREPAK